MALAKKTRHKKHEEHISEAWLVPYADILTLLLALFIVLFASSTVDQQKLEQMSAVFNQVFDGGIGVLDNPSPTEPIIEASPEATEAMKRYMTDQQQLEQTQAKVEELIAVNELENQFETKLTDEGLLITIRDSVLFQPGSAQINQDQIMIAQGLAQLLSFNPERNVIITGHTDNVPINNPEFSSNMELSAIRAVNFLKTIVDSNSALDEKYFSVRGFGENIPIASNDTPENRAKNRRVEVLVQPLVAEDGTALPAGTGDPVSPTVEEPAANTDSSN